MLKRLTQADFIGDVVIKEVIDVEPVGSLRRSREPEQEPRREVINNRPVAVGAGFVNLVNDDVVKPLPWHHVQVLGQRLHGCEQVIGRPVCPAPTAKPYFFAPSTRSNSLRA